MARRALARRARGTSPYATLDYLIPPRQVDDDAIKLVALTRSGYPCGVILVSSPVSPGLVERGMQNAARAKEELGSQLGRKILTPLGCGCVGGLSYSILPFRPPLSGRGLRRRWQRSILRPGLFRWLHEATRVTMRRPRPAEVESGFVRPLRHVIELESASHRVRAAAENALARLEKAAWNPRFVLMHGDLWWRNILLADGRAEGVGLPRRDRFVIIDWPGSRFDGHAMYDLVRLSESVKASRRHFAREVAGHCRLLECEPVDAIGYHLAAVGSIGLDLEYYSPKRYRKMIERTHEYVRVGIQFDG